MNVKILCKSVKEFRKLESILGTCKTLGIVTDTLWDESIESCIRDTNGVMYIKMDDKIMYCENSCNGCGSRTCEGLSTITYQKYLREHKLKRILDA